MTGHSFPVFGTKSRIVRRAGGLHREAPKQAVEEILPSATDPDNDDLPVDGTDNRRSVIVGVSQVLSRLCCLSVIVVTLTTLAARFFWVADLLANLRMQQVIAILVLGAILVLIKQFRYAGILGCCLIVHLAAMVPQIAAKPNRIAKNGEAVRVMTINALTSNLQHASVANEITEDSPDIVAVLELSSALESYLRDELSATYPYRVESSSDAGNFGIGLYSKRKLENVVRFRLNENILSIQADCSGMRIIATHPLPPMGKQGFRSRNEHIRQLADRVSQLRSETPSIPVVVMGDFNLTPWSPHYRSFLNSSGLRRAKLGWGIAPTWYADGSSFPFGLVIDHIFISEELGCDNYRVGNDVGSDHRSVSVRLGTEAP